MVQGRIVARVFTSDAEIPLHDASVSITRKTVSGARELLAFRLTDQAGLIPTVMIQTPEPGQSQNVQNSTQPFALVDMMAEQVGFDRIMVENVQVFPQVETVQNFQMIPTAELPDAYDLTDVFHITGQNL